MATTSAENCVNETQTGATVVTVAPSDHEKQRRVQSERETGTGGVETAASAADGPLGRKTGALSSGRADRAGRRTAGPATGLAGRCCRERIEQFHHLRKCELWGAVSTHDDGVALVGGSAPQQL